MFCPKCQSLCFPDLNNNIQCVRYQYNYSGPAQSIVLMPDQGSVDLSIPVVGWTNSFISVCRGMGCSNSVYLGRNFCGSCQDNSGMMPGAYYRAWPY